MTVGMRTYSRIKRCEQKANDLGFKFKSADVNFRDGDNFVLITDGEKIPVYRSGSELFKGSLEELESFLYGIEWARQYDRSLRLNTDQRREKAEQRIRNEDLLKTIKESGNNDGEEDEEEHYPF
jgi:hypothetical protein